jgi:2-C-methyl-D-erythritol 4-phosphate cytidylyltransferase
MGARDVGVILAAAGSGSRFGGRKQFIELRGRPLLHYSLDAFSSVPAVGEIVIVGPGDDLDRVRATCDAWIASAVRVAAVPPELSVVRGGADRTASVRHGLEALSAIAKVVLVHDAARPLVLPAEIVDVIDAIRSRGAAAIGHPSTDSVHEERDGCAWRRLDRDRIWQVQTPQGATRRLLDAAYERPSESKHTDEVSLLRAAAIDVVLVAGSPENIKVTRPSDVELAELFLSRRGH